MAAYIAKMKYVDIREIYVEADSMDEALEKYKAGDFEGETLDYYADEELKPLTLKQ